MGQDEFKPKLGRIRDSASNAQLRTNTQVLRETGRSGARAVRQRGHITSAMPKRGMGAGVRAAAGLIAPGSRRVIVNHQEGDEHKHDGCTADQHFAVDTRHRLGACTGNERAGKRRLGARSRYPRSRCS